MGRVPVPYRGVLLKISMYILNLGKQKSVGHQMSPRDRVGHNEISPWNCSSNLIHLKYYRLLCFEDVPMAHLDTNSATYPSLPAPQLVMSHNKPGTDQWTAGNNHCREEVTFASQSEKTHKLHNISFINNLILLKTCMSFEKCQIPCYKYIQ